MHIMRSAHAPKYQTSREHNSRHGESPESLLGLEDPLVAPCELESHPIRNQARVEGCGDDADHASEVAEADHAGGEVVGGAAEDDGGGCVEDLVGALAMAVRESSMALGQLTLNQMR